MASLVVTAPRIFQELHLVRVGLRVKARARARRRVNQDHPRAAPVERFVDGRFEPLGEALERIGTLVVGRRHEGVAGA
jgi:hypothetical protein